MYTTAEDINKLNYTDFIAFIKETNRCPGGKSTIRKVLVNTLTNSNSRVLDVGSNTGFNTLEIARVTKSKVSGIDISRSCVEQSILQLTTESDSIKKNTDFRVGSAYDIPFKAQEFDLVFTGGATSFMDDKRKAIDEYLRVTKDWGFICMTPLVYIKNPPQSVLDSVGSAIGAEIKKMTSDDWIDTVLKSSPQLELYYEEQATIRNDYRERVDNYINYFMTKPHIQDLDLSVRNAVQKKWRGYLDVFMQNQDYLGFAILIFRKRRDIEEPVLFVSND